jgi:hypothetical protein
VQDLGENSGWIFRGGQGANFEMKIFEKMFSNVKMNAIHCYHSIRHIIFTVIAFKYLYCQGSQPDFKGIFFESQ